MYVPQRSHWLLQPQPIPDCVECLAQRASTHRGWDVQSSALLSLDGDSAGTKLIGSLQLRRTAQNASKPAMVPQPPPPLQSKNSVFPMKSWLKAPGIAHKNALGCIAIKFCHYFIIVKYFRVHTACLILKPGILNGSEASTFFLNYGAQWLHEQWAFEFHQPVFKKVTSTGVNSLRQKRC